MPYIKDKGNPTARMWFVLESPYGSDIPKNTLMSGGMSSVWNKMLLEAGIDPLDCYFTSRAPNTDDPKAFTGIDGLIQQYAPPIVCVLNEVGGAFLPELQKKGIDSKGQLQKYAGSLLNCTRLSYEHYMIPMFGPDRCVADWKERNVTTYIDLQKAKDELDYWRTHKQLRPLPERKLIYGNLALGEILAHLETFLQARLLSIDIETVYPRDKSAYIPHPGYPITIGLAASSHTGISFNLFRDDPKENRILWRALDNLIKRTTILGQNFFNFDALFFEMLGFSVPLDRVKDTLLRHHILWPELSHKLQFMTRQYTREPYYKDEGHGWTVKNMDRLRRYNCLDVCVTMEIYEEQEKEFKERPQLR